MSLSIFAVVKYASACFAAGYGLYATINNFHEEREGRKVLSRKGYWGILFLGISSVLSVSTDGWKDARDAEEKIVADQKAETRRRELSDTLTVQIEQTKSIVRDVQDQKSRTGEILSNLERELSLQQRNTNVASSILAQTERAVRPVKEIKYFYGYSLPRDNKDVQQYVERINRYLASLTLPDVKDYQELVGKGLTFTQNPDTGMAYLNISIDSDLYPNDQEEVMQFAVAGVGLEMEFFASAQTFRSAKAGGDFIADIDMSTLNIDKDSRKVSYELPTHRLWIFPHGTVTLTAENSNQRIMSLADIEQSWILLSVSKVGLTDEDNMNERLEAISRGITFSIMQLDTQHVSFVAKEIKASNNGLRRPVFGGRFKELFSTF
jgi:hypothetical protein